MRVSKSVWRYYQTPKIAVNHRVDITRQCALFTRHCSLLLRIYQDGEKGRKTNSNADERPMKRGLKRSEVSAFIYFDQWPKTVFPQAAIG
jgi:hypothetical protein